MLKRCIRTDVYSSALGLLLLFPPSALVQLLGSLSFLSELNSKGQNIFRIVNDWHNFFVLIAVSNHTTFGLKSTHKLGSIHTLQNCLKLLFYSTNSVAYCCSVYGGPDTVSTQ